MVTFDAAEPGTSREIWEQDARFAALPEFDPTQYPAVLVFAAHPDDETLGAGGLIARCANAGIPVHVICVTDGAASHNNVPDLAATRQRELQEALRILHPDIVLRWLAFSDGRAEAQVAEVSAAIAGILGVAPAGALVVAPWRGDAHPDHRVVAELAVRHSGGRTVLEYPIWMWHWASPDHDATPWRDLVAVEINADVKQRAIEAFASQVRVPITGQGEPLLRADFLEHFRRPVESFVASTEAFGADYFESLYANSADPWSFRTRWYESRKRAVTLASLTRERFANALEIGCSVGHLTEMLAERCDAVLAVDIAERAIAEASTSEPAHVRFEVRDALADFPEGQFDLVVLSEVGYYWGETELREIRTRIRDHLTTDGLLVACHWRHPVAGHRLSGDRVHAILREERWHRLVAHMEEDFVLEIFGLEALSVAAREGLK